VNDLQHWTLQAGASVRALDQPGAREALIFYKDLFTTQAVAPASAPQEDYGTNLQAFLDGKLAMWWVWDAFYGQMTLEPEFWKDQVTAFSVLPAGPANAGTSIGAWGWSISKFADNKDQAKQWVAYTSRPEVMKLLSQRSTTPARTSLWADPEYQETTPQIALLSAMSEQGDPFVGRPVSAGFQEVSDAAEQNVHAFLTDQVDVDTAIERAMEKINEVNEREGI
jgi:ABC-type glycerol-3-phosphate transport system substrate-binding protein